MSDNNKLNKPEATVPTPATLKPEKKRKTNAKEDLHAEDDDIEDSNEAMPTQLAKSPVDVAVTKLRDCIVGMDYRCVQVGHDRKRTMVVLVPIRDYSTNERASQ